MPGQGRCPLSGFNMNFFFSRPRVLRLSPGMKVLNSYSTRSRSPPRIFMIAIGNMSRWDCEKKNFPCTTAVSGRQGYGGLMRARPVKEDIFPGCREGDCIRDKAFFPDKTEIAGSNTAGVHDPVVQRCGSVRSSRPNRRRSRDPPCGPRSSVPQRTVLVLPFLQAFTKSAQVANPHPPQLMPAGLLPSQPMRTQASEAAIFFASRRKNPMLCSLPSFSSRVASFLQSFFASTRISRVSIPFPFGAVRAARAMRSATTITPFCSGVMREYGRKGWINITGRVFLRNNR